MMDGKNIKLDDKALHRDGEPGGLIFAVSAPSGTGKTTLCNMLLQELKDIKLSISYTTRTKRQGEEDGISYNFINDSEFDRMIKDDEFIEWANVFGKRYGTAYKSVFNPNSLSDVLLEIDVQGVGKLLKIYGGAAKLNKLKGSGGAESAGAVSGNGNIENKIKRLVSIFVTPPSYDELSERLKKRGGMDEAELNKRLNTAYEEIKKSVFYDYIVTNDDLNGAYLKLKSIVIAERCKNLSLIMNNNNSEEY